MPRKDLKPPLGIIQGRGLVNVGWRRADRLCLYIKNIMKWRHASGFSSHNGMQIRRDDQNGRSHWHSL